MRPAGPRRAGTAVSAALAAVLLSGCGAAVDKVTEEAAEKAAGAAAGGEVEIDRDDGSLRVESEEGSLSMGSGSLPESFPETVPLPEDDYEVLNTLEASSGDIRAQVTLLLPGDQDDAAALAAQLEEELTAAGYEITDTRTTTGSGMAHTTVGATNEDHGLLLSVTATEEDGEITVSYMVAPPQ